MRLVFATNNKHKLEEIAHAVGSDIDIVSLQDIHCEEDIPETADTLEGNALQKARYIYEKYGSNCFADDTGLEIDTLDGRPGVYSARYAGEAKDPVANMEKVLQELQGRHNRLACFRTVIALILNGKEYLFEGIVSGKIIDDKRGAQGFGYDPIFIPSGFTQTFAEMPLEVKNTISHRARATEKLITFLKGQATS